MAKVEGRALLTATITVALTESEAEALNAIVSYGDTEFLKVFYEHMGRAYLEPHEAGLRSLFHSIRDGECGIRKILENAKAARKTFYGL